MKAYKSRPRSSVDLHAGVFSWERYTVSLEIAADGRATYERVQINAGTGQRLFDQTSESEHVRYIGKVIKTGGESWLELRFPLPESNPMPGFVPSQTAQHLVVRAVEVDDELICDFYSEALRRSWSELLVMQNGAAL